MPSSSVTPAVRERNLTPAGLKPKMLLKRNGAGSLNWHSPVTGAKYAGSGMSGTTAGIEMQMSISRQENRCGCTRRPKHD